MIYNLVCLEGHVFFSPNPENWIGKDCTYKYLDGKKAKICREELVQYDDPDAN